MESSGENGKPFTRFQDFLTQQLISDASQQEARTTSDAHAASSDLDPREQRTGAGYSLRRARNVSNIPVSTAAKSHSSLSLRQNSGRSDPAQEMDKFDSIHEKTDILQTQRLAELMTKHVYTHLDPDLVVVIKMAFDRLHTLQTDKEANATLMSDHITKLENQLETFQKDNLTQSIMSSATMIQSLDSKLTDLQNQIATLSSQQIPTAEPTYADKVRSAAKPTLIISSKDQSSSIQELQTSLEEIPFPSLVSINKTFRSHNRLFVECKAQADLDMINQAIQQNESLKNKLDTRERQQKKTQVILFNVPESTDSESICALICSALGLQRTAVPIETVRNFPSQRANFTHWVFSLPSALAHQLILTRVLYLGLRRINCQRHIEFKRCQKCQSFHHRTPLCTNKRYFCANCNGSHHVSECSSPDDLCCINCLDSNVNEETSYPTNHKASDNKCPFFLAYKQAQLETIRGKHRSHKQPEHSNDDPQHSQDPVPSTSQQAPLKQQPQQIKPKSSKVRLVPFYRPAQLSNTNSNRPASTSA